MFIFSVEEIEDLLAETSEAVEKQKEIDQLLSGQLTEVNILKGGDIWAVYYTSPKKFYDNVFLFVGLTNFDWLVHYYKCLNISTFNCKLHQFISQCQ